MGLIEKIRNLFKKEQVIPSTNITRYDTSSISIPKYLELSEEAKKVVDGYIEEIDLEKLDTLMLYADEMSEYANANTELLLKLFFRITQKPLEFELSRLSDEEIAERRLDALIQREEVGLYKQGLENLEEESTLRAVALEEIKRRESKRKFDFLGLFGRAERLKRKNQMELLELATERMKISKKTIEQQMAVVKNEIESEESISTSLDVYNALQRSSDKTLDDKALRIRAQKLIPMASLVIPNEVNSLQRKAWGIYFKKKDAVEFLAEVQRKLDVYAYTHRKDIEQLRQEVSEIKKQKKTTKKREELLSRVNQIRTMYKVFGQYITSEDLQSLYEAKFEVLTIGANEQDKSPFEEIKNNEEKEYYRKIIEAKLEDILLGRNAYFANEFGKNQSKAMQIVREIIQKENGDYSGEKVLTNQRILALLLSFEGTEEFIKFFKEAKFFDQNDLVERFDNASKNIKWEDKLTLETISRLEGSIIPKNSMEKLSPWIKLILKSSLENCFREGIISRKDGFWQLPEGIREIVFYSFVSGVNSYDKKLFHELQKISKNDTVICPSTLRIIKTPTYIEARYLYDINITGIELNEGLEEIQDYAFEDRSIKRITFPHSLRRIGKYAFTFCSHLEEVVFNEGLESIGRGAFSRTGLRKAILPKSLRIIDEKTFEFCSHLKEIVFNEGLESIGKHAFSRTDLRKVILPKSLRIIEKSAFYYCEYLEEVVFNEGLESIGEYAFSHNGLRKAILPKSVQTIKDYAFVACTKLEQVVINEGMESIGKGAFENALDLKDFSIPSHHIKAAHSIISSDYVRENTINLRIRGLEVEEGCLEQYLRFDIRRIKSIEIMNEESLAIHHNIKYYDKVEKEVRRTMQKIQKYKQRQSQQEESSR